MTTVAINEQSAAERRAMKISLRLDTIADNFDAVMPMIREALSLGDHETLGYRSPGEYISDRFGKALSRIPTVMRREVVQELSAAGMSTRAIAPVVGVDQKTVVRDLARGEAHASPEPDPNVFGLDGKAYPRTERRAAPRKKLPDAAYDTMRDLGKATERLERIVRDERFDLDREAIRERLGADLKRYHSTLWRVRQALNGGGDD